MSTAALDSAAHARMARFAAGIRARVLELTLQRGGCYLSQALSSAEILAVLYGHALKLGPSSAPAQPGPFPGVPGPGLERSGLGGKYNGAGDGSSDRLLISPAHYAVAVYAALVEAGRLAPQGLAQFNTDGSTVEMIGGEHSPGFELTTGSFGQALSQAAGIAWARRRRKAQGRVCVFMSDGELQEGQSWEALQAIAHHGLSSIAVVCDVNGQQVDGSTSDVMGVEPLAERIEAFGCRAAKVDGHDINQLCAALQPDPEADRALVVLAYTDTARGLPAIAGRKPHLHYVRWRSDEEKEACAQALARMQEEIGQWS